MTSTIDDAATGTPREASGAGSDAQQGDARTDAQMGGDRPDAAESDGGAGEPATDEIASMSFEAAYRALNEAVAQLEAGGQTLDSALQLHARGVALAARCDALLGAAELRVREVGAAGEDLGPVEVR